MTDRIAKLSTLPYPNPPAIGNIWQGKPAEAQHVKKMFAAQDHVLTPGRRIIMAVGMHGNPTHRVSDMDIAQDDAFFPQPDPNDKNVVLSIKDHPITPGHFLRIEAHCIPSGPTGENNSGSLDYTGDSGSVVLAATWDDGTTTELVTSTLAFPAPISEYGHGPDLSGMGFTGLQSKWTRNHPAGILFDTGELVSWTQAGVTVTATLSFQGGVRPVDVVVFEEPYKIGRADGVPHSPAHIFQAFEAPLPAYPLEYPAEGASSGDRRFGSAYGLDVAVAAQQMTGPSILSLSSHTGAITSSSEPDPWEVTSTSFAPLGWTAAVGASDEAPSFDFSAATFGRRFESSSESHALEDTGVCRVKVAVYWAVESGGECRIRFRTGDHSFIELATTSTSYGWSEAIGHLECGQTVLDAVQLHVEAEVDSTYTGYIRYIQVEHYPD